MVAQNAPRNRMHLRRQNAFDENDDLVEFGPNTLGGNMDDGKANKNEESNLGVSASKETTNLYQK